MTKEQRDPRIAARKSTLASLVAGLRAPYVGTLALDGVAQSELGLARWRERVASCRNENHVSWASVLFNLLLGRVWPPRREDVTLAEALCRDLDLDGLLGRIPSGLEQLVGEGGWQLSHGERSRLFIARAAAATRPAHPRRELRGARPRSPGACSSASRPARRPCS